MKNKTKIWLAFLLPLSAISIVTPMVLSSCSNSEQAPPVNPDGKPPVNPDGKPPVNPDVQPPVNPDGKPPVNPDVQPPVNPDGKPPVNPDGKPELPINKISKFNAKNHTKQELSNKYILAELIRDFVTLPKGTNISQMLEEKAVNNIWFPASTSFHSELTKGFLFDFIKTKYIFKDIKSIDIANGSKFLITKPTINDPSSFGKLSITVDIKTTPDQPTHNIAPTNGITRMSLEITPHFTTFKEVVASDVELTLLDREFGNTSERKRNEVISLYNEFSNGNDSILEQTISSHMNSKGGLVSYLVKLTEIKDNNKEKLTLGDTVISFVPFKIKKNYSYIQTKD